MYFPLCPIFHPLVFHSSALRKAEEVDAKRLSAEITKAAAVRSSGGEGWLLGVKNMVEE